MEKEFTEVDCEECLDTGVVFVGQFDDIEEAPCINPNCKASSIYKRESLSESYYEDNSINKL